MDMISDSNRLHILPFMKRWNFLNFILYVVDILVIACAFQCAYLINYPGNGFFFFTEKYLFLLFLGIIPFWIFILFLIKITKVTVKHYQVMFLLYMLSTLVILFLVIVFYFVFKLNRISRLFLIESSFIGSLLLYFVHILEYMVFKIYGAKGHIHKNIVIIADDSSLHFIENFLLKEGLGYKVVVIFTESALIKEKYEKRSIILPEKYLGIVNDLIEVDSIDEILYLKEKLVPSEVRETVTSCEELGVTFRLKYDKPIVSLSSAIMTDIENGKFLSFINIPRKSFALAIKKAIDINLSLLMIIVLIPGFILIGILIKLTSRGPILYKQAVVGLKGRQFNLYKFRTMIQDINPGNRDFESRNEILGPESGIIKDTGVTKIGRFLRKSGLDELPQLFNVLKGELPMIGSRHPIHNHNLDQPDF